jgi:hypothetical protein
MGRIIADYRNPFPTQFHFGLDCKPHHLSPLSLVKVPLSCALPKEENIFCDAHRFSFSGF